MKLEQQVCSLEQAKRLKEFGVKQESIFTYAFDKLNDRWGISTRPVEALELIDKSNNRVSEHGYYSAFTVSELGEFLPDEIVKHFDFPGYEIPKSKEYLLTFKLWFWDETVNRTYGCRYDYNHNPNIGTPSFNGAMVNAIAELVIHLIEQGLIKV